MEIITFTSKDHKFLRLNRLSSSMPSTSLPKFKLLADSLCLENFLIESDLLPCKPIGLSSIFLGQASAPSTPPRKQ